MWAVQLVRVSETTASVVATLPSLFPMSTADRLCDGVNRILRLARCGYPDETRLVADLGLGDIEYATTREV